MIEIDTCIREFLAVGDMRRWDMLSRRRKLPAVAVLRYFGCKVGQ